MYERKTETYTSGTGKLWPCSRLVLRVGRVDQNDGRARVGVRHDHQVGALGRRPQERLRVGERVERREAREEALRRRRVERLRWWRRRGLVYQWRRRLRGQGLHGVEKSARGRGGALRFITIGGGGSRGRRLGVKFAKVLLLLALEGLDLAPARHARGVDGVQRAVAERRQIVRQAALLDLLVYCILEVRERLLPEACVVGARDRPARGGRDALRKIWWSTLLPTGV